MRALFFSTWAGVAIIFSSLVPGPSAAATESHASKPCISGIVKVLALGSGAYLLRIGSSEPGERSGQATIYTASRSYALALTNVELVADRTVNSDDLSTYRSTPVYFRLPSSEAVDAIEVSFSAVTDHASDLSCAPARYYAADPVWKKKNDAAGDAALVDGFIRDRPNVAAVTPLTAEAPLTCAKPYVDAALVQGAMPEYPYEAFRQHLGGKVQVMLGLAPNGKVSSAVVFRSDAADVLQRSAVHAAVTSTYSPEVFRCAQVGGYYLFTANFSPQ